MSQPQPVRNQSLVVQFYQSEEYLSEGVGRFLADGFREGNPMILIATPEHIPLFLEELRSRGYDLELAVRSGSLAELDARETLARFMDDSLPNGDRFHQVMRDIIRRSSAGRPNRPVIVYSEMVDVLWQEEKYECAIALEQFWNHLSSAYDLRLLCAYSMEQFQTEADRTRFDAICRAHIARLRRGSLALDRGSADMKQGEDARFFLTALSDCDDYAIIGKTLGGMITSWNRGAERILGYTAEEMLGKPIARLIPTDSAMEEAGILECIREGGRVEHYETRRVRKDGSIIDVSLSVSPVRNAKGEIICQSQIAHDITEKKRIEADIQAASRMKDEFLAVLSHELRTPLHVILAWANILKSCRSQDVVQGAVGTIHRNAEMLKRLIDELLDMSRIFTGKMTIKSERVDLPAVAKAALASVRSAAVAKAIAVELSVDEPVQSVAGDSARLQQVIWNLLANAIKFTPSNGKVQLRLRNDGPDVEVTVRDTGEGISAEFLPYVFEPFRQENASTTRKHGGIGAGLAVVQSLVEAHGGTVRAGSDGHGQGTTFVLRLPIFSQRFMKTGLEVVYRGVYATDCCLEETGLEERQAFPRCPKCLGITVWVPVRFTPARNEKKAA